MLFLRENNIVEIICRKHKRKNYYEVLGVPSVASHLEIKKAGGIG